MLGKHLGKVPFGIGEVLARERDDLLITKVIDADLCQTGQPAVLGDRQQIFVIRHRKN